MEMDEFDILKMEGGMRIAIEVLGASLLVMAAYLIAIEPFLHSVAPVVYAQTGLEYSRTNPPDTASEVTHLLLTVSAMGATLYWRLYFTDLGQQLRDEVAEEY